MLDYKKVLRDLQYKPNFGFTAYEHEGLWRIRVIMLAEDARKPWKRWEIAPYPQDNEEVWYYIDRQIPPPKTGIGYSPSRELVEVMGNYTIPPFQEDQEDAFVEWMLYTLRKMEDHETDEWFRYKGELINDPHEEV